MENPRQAQERLAIRIGVATENDIPAIRKLRIFAAQNDKDAYFLATTLEEEQEKTDAELKEEMFDDGFVVLAWSGTEAIGMSRAEKGEEEGEWYLGSAYVKPEFRTQLNEAVALRMFGEILVKIIAEGATRISFLVRKSNSKMVEAAQLAGAVIVGETGKGLGYSMELDLTSSEVIKRLTRIFQLGL